MSRGHLALRWRDDGWEARCPDCKHKAGGKWWPLTDEFWMKANMARCRACNLSIRRAKDRLRPRDPEYMRAYRAGAKRAIALYNRDYYAANRDRILTQVADYAERNRERIAQRARQRYLEKREELLAQKRAYYRANAERLKAKASARYYAKKAARMDKAA